MRGLDAGMRGGSASSVGGAPPAGPPGPASRVSASGRERLAVDRVRDRGPGDSCSAPKPSGRRRSPVAGARNPRAKGCCAAARERSPTAPRRRRRARARRRSVASFHDVAREGPAPRRRPSTAGVSRPCGRRTLNSFQSRVPTGKSHVAGRLASIVVPGGRWIQRAWRAVGPERVLRRERAIAARIDARPSRREESRFRRAARGSSGSPSARSPEARAGRRCCRGSDQQQRERTGDHRAAREVIHCPRADRPAAGTRFWIGGSDCR